MSVAAETTAEPAWHCDSWLTLPTGPGGRILPPGSGDAAGRIALRCVGNPNHHGEVHGSGTDPAIHWLGGDIWQVAGDCLPRVVPVESSPVCDHPDVAVTRFRSVPADTMGGAWPVAHCMPRLTAFELSCGHEVPARGWTLQVTLDPRRAWFEANQ